MSDIAYATHVLRTANRVSAILFLLQMSDFTFYDTGLKQINDSRVFLLNVSYITVR